MKLNLEVKVVVLKVIGNSMYNIEDAVAVDIEVLLLCI